LKEKGGNVAKYPDRNTQNMESCILYIILFLGGFVLLLAYGVLVNIISIFLASIALARRGRWSDAMYPLRFLLIVIIVVGSVVMIILSVSEGNPLSKPLTILLTIIFLALLVLGPIRGKWLGQGYVHKIVTSWYRSRGYPEFIPLWLSPYDVKTYRSISYDEMLRMI